MADQATERGAGALGELPGHALLVLRLHEPDLDQLVVAESLVHLPHDGLAETGTADLDEGLEGVGETAQVLALIAFELGHGGDLDREPGTRHSRMPGPGRPAGAGTLAPRPARGLRRRVKKVAAAVLLLVLAVAFGPRLAHEALDWKQREDARRRVEWMLKAKVAEDEQVAICQWARGKIVMPMGDIEAALPDWEAFWASSGLGDGRWWEVVDKTIVDGATVDVTLVRGEDRVVLRVREGAALERIYEDD